MVAILVTADSTAAVIEHGDYLLRAVSTASLRARSEERGPTGQTWQSCVDILLVLVQHVGEVVGHKELVAKVWPDVFVEEVSLRVHIAALCKALDTGEAGARCLINMRGRGYCFVAPTSREWVESSVPAAEMSFDTVYHVCNNASLRKAARRLGKLYDAVLEPSGLKATQFNLLTQIHALGQPTMAGLADSLLMDLSAMRRSLGPLIRDGLVLLRLDAEDRRVKRVVLTAAGVAKFKQAMQLWRKGARPL